MVFTNRETPRGPRARESAPAGPPAAPLGRYARAGVVAGAVLAGLGCLLLFLGLIVGPRLAGG